MYPYDDEEDTDILTGQSLMPNQPRDPEDPREKLKSYLAEKARAERQMASPDYRAAMREPGNIVAGANADIAFGQGLQNAANQFGQIGGKVAANPMADYGKALQQQNLGTAQGIERERADLASADDRRGRMLAELAKQYGTNEQKASMADIAGRKLELQKSKEEREAGHQKEMESIERQKLAYEKEKLPAAAAKKQQELRDLEASGQKKAGVFDQLRDLRKSTSMTGPLAGRVGQAANVLGFGVSEEFDKLNAKQMAMVNAYIKETTGASAGVEEMKRLMQVMPSVSDNDNLFENKLQALEEETNAIINERRMAMGLPALPGKEKMAGGNQTVPGKTTGAMGAVGGQTPPSEVKRKTKDGRNAIFDANTKEFLRYE